MRQGDILNYNPDLEIYSQPSTDIIGETARTYSLADDITTIDDLNKSLSVREFEAQLPTKQVKNAVNLLTKIQTYMDNIENTATSNEYILKYFSTTTNEEAEKILNANASDMVNGSSKLEVYNALVKMQEEIKALLDLYITCMFGKDVDIDSVEEIVSAYLDKINQYESNEEYTKVNYFALYYDTQISYLFGQYVLRMDEVSAELSFINDKERKLDINDVNTDLFKSAFDKANKILDYDLLKDENTSDDIQTSMKNIFLTKQKINGYLEIFSTIYKLEDGIDEMQEIKQESIDDLESKLDNLLRTTVYSKLAKSDICTSIRKKANYRSFFVT